MRTQITAGSFFDDYYDFFKKLAQKCEVESRNCVYTDEGLWGYSPNKSAKSIAKIIKAFAESVGFEVYDTDFKIVGMTEIYTGLFYNDLDNPTEELSFVVSAPETANNTTSLCVRYVPM